MYTAEERKQIEELEYTGHNTVFATTIKEVTGGFIIEHTTSYTNQDEIVVAVTRAQTVCQQPYDVTEAIGKLYGTIERDGQATRPVPEPERYDIPTNTGIGMRESTADYTPKQYNTLKESQEAGEFMGKGDPKLRASEYREQMAQSAAASAERSYVNSEKTIL